MTDVRVALLRELTSGSMAQMHESDHAGREGSTPLALTLEDGSILKVWPVLGFAEGDIPWMALLSNSIGHGGKHACYRCAFNGEWDPAAKTVRCVHLPYDTSCA